jgi:hypothetical protein
VSELLLNIEINQASLNHSDQVTVVIWDNESHRTLAPGAQLAELCEPGAVLWISGFERNPGPPDKC